MSAKQTPNQAKENDLNLGRLTRSLAYNFHNDYAKLCMDFKSMSGSSTNGSTDDYTRKKELLAWSKEKIAILNEFRFMLRVPYDINLYGVINTVQERMFKRHQHIISVVDQCRDLANFLNQIKLPIFAVEEALDIIKQGKKPLDYFKLDYLLKVKKADRNFEDLEKLILEKDTQEEAAEEKKYTGIFENIGFCINKYFQNHHYIGEKAFCRIGNLAEVELYYRPKENVKFVIDRIKLLRSFDVFSTANDNKAGMTKMQYDLYKLAVKINEKINKEFVVSVDDVINQDFPEMLKDFEAYEEHEDEHRQIAKILKYIKKFLKTLIIQILYDKFTLKQNSDKKFNKNQEIHKINFDFQKMVISVISGKPYLLLYPSPF